jgi:hypothetical protein
MDNVAFFQEGTSAVGSSHRVQDKLESGYKLV